MIFSATGRVALARVRVVVMRPCSNRLVTRLRKVARRCHGLRPSFDPDFKCRMASLSLYLLQTSRFFLVLQEAGTFAPAFLLSRITGQWFRRWLAGRSGSA